MYISEHDERATAGERERVRASDFPCSFLLFALRNRIHSAVCYVLYVLLLCVALLCISHTRPLFPHIFAFYFQYFYVFVSLDALVFLHISCTTDARHHTSLALTE
jgi:hypothetical protein